MNKIDRNSSIDIFRYVCALMVVMIHTKLFTDINFQLGYFFTQIVPRVGVPFFFAVSGYFYFQKLEKKQIVFISYVKRILITYSMWSLIYYSVDFIVWGHTNLKAFVVSCVYQYIITGSHYHFWFFPALINSICIVTILYKLKLKRIIVPLSICLYVVGCLGLSYYNLAKHIPVLNYLFELDEFDVIRKIFFMGFPFFVSGYVIYKIYNILKDKKYSWKKFILLEMMGIFFWIAEISIVIFLEYQRSIVLTFGLYPLVVITVLFLIRTPLPQFNRLSRRCRILANFTYYVHPLIIEGIAYMAIKYMQCNLKTIILLLITVIVTFILGNFIIFVNNRYLNKLVN